MLYCPSCGAAHPDHLSICPVCGVPLVETPGRPPVTPPGEWVTVYRGTGVGFRAVQASLEEAGIQTVRLPGEGVELFPIEASRGSEVILYALAIPAETYEARREEVDALIAAGSGTEADAEAAREAEEDYDVRGCPTCLLFFHRNYARCPGCGAELAPAVDCFDEGEAAPDRVIVGDGDETSVRELEGQLREAGFDAQAVAVEGWPVNAVDLPWEEVMDRTAEAETVLGLR